MLIQLSLYSITLPNNRGSLAASYTLMLIYPTFVLHYVKPNLHTTCKQFKLCSKQLQATSVKIPQFILGLLPTQLEKQAHSRSAMQGSLA